MLHLRLCSSSVSALVYAPQAQSGGAAAREHLHAVRRGLLFLLAVVGAVLVLATAGWRLEQTDPDAGGLVADSAFASICRAGAPTCVEILVR